MNKLLVGILAITFVAVLGVGFVAAFPFEGKLANSDLSDEEKTEMQEQMQEMQNAIAEGDYETWKVLMQERIAKMQEGITEENFNALVEKYQEREQMRAQMQEAFENGEFEGMPAPGECNSEDGECPMHRHHMLSMKFSESEE